MHSSERVSELKLRRCSAIKSRLDEKGVRGVQGQDLAVQIIPSSRASSAWFETARLLGRKIAMI